MSYVPPHLRRAQGNESPSTSGSGLYPYGQTIAEEEHKPKTVIAGQDSIDTYEILQKTGPLSMAEKLALSAGEAAATTSKRGKQPSKRQAQLKMEKESIITDKDFYDEQVKQLDLPLEKVVVSSSVLTQIVQHAESKKFESATGQLLGSTNKGVLTISTAFPFEGDQNYAQNKATLQMENLYPFDNVGWYSTMNMDSHLDMTTIAAQYRYQWANGNQCVFLVYDTSASDLKGVMRLKALRLSDKFMDIVRRVAESNQSTSLKNSSNKQQQEEELKKQIQLKVQYGGLPSELPHIDKQTLKGLTVKELYNEIQIEYYDNDLITSFLQDLDSELRLDTYCEEKDSLDLNTRVSLQKRMQGLYSSQKEYKKLIEKDSNKAGLDLLVVKGRLYRHLRDIESIANEGNNKVHLVSNILPQRE